MTTIIMIIHHIQLKPQNKPLSSSAMIQTPFRLSSFIYIILIQHCNCACTKTWAQRIYYKDGRQAYENIPAFRGRIEILCHTTVYLLTYTPITENQQENKYKKKNRAIVSETTSDTVCH